MITESEIQEIIDRVRRKLGDAGEQVGSGLRGAAELEAISAVELGDGIHATVDEAVAAAKCAYNTFRGAGLEARKTIISAVRASMLQHGEQLAEMAHAETGLGRVEDKIVKNRVVTVKAPGPEDLELEATTGDLGMMVTEFAPFGVIGSITPTTNPTSTIINNTIAVVSAGNALVFNVHPGAKRVSAENVRMINRAIVAAGGPPDLVTAIPNPTIASAHELMVHPDVPVLLVTGGGGVVKEAMRTNKRVVAAGPGNPPSVVDQTADLDKAARDIILGGSFDNNIVCVDEKTVIAVDTIADSLVRRMSHHGAYVLKEHELRRIERVIFSEMGPPSKPGVINKAWIGKNVGEILAEIGVQVGSDVRLAVAEVPVEHNLVWTEQMLPVVPVVRVSDVDRAIDLAVRSEHGFRHTASIHSTNVDTITRMARAMNCSIFVANGPHYAGLGEGGEGFTSFSIASPTGDGLTRPRTFSRERRITVVGSLRIV
ncbi:aldehyde-alcohol dehydrogenase [bacterium BMS3Abin02]|nr:aldehyde-alcohol dehydrogenase [bacterium BMS3Abin02]GBE23490.1 aldehyde-alcohol dehydrogenase [bacterium BMS3Bbin01]HDH25799.1 aldehyde dehydrogenase family protein [Actinomycetota bacterium]HDL49025.1 aldehyde dehydrogenase family protein [Actinomycetota bacterium]